MDKGLKDILKDIANELETLSVAIIELQAVSQGKNPQTAREISAATLRQRFDTLRSRIDALK